MSKLGERIKTVRKGLGITQAKLAEMIGKNPNLYARYERGEVRMNADIITSIAHALGMSTSELIGDNGSPDTTSKTQNEHIPNMSYWGGVVDNIRQLIKRGDMAEITLVYPLLKSGYEMLIQSNNFSDTSLFDIRQTNIGRDATVNFGTIQPITGD